MRLLTKNILEDNSSITMTNFDANYPVERVYSNMLEEYVKASAASTTITITFAVEQRVDAIFFGYHNANNITFVFKDEADVILSTNSFDFPEQKAREYIDAITTVRKIEVTLVSSSDVFIGNIAVGKYTQCYNVAKPFAISYSNTSKYEQTDGGQVLHRKGVRLASFDLILNKNTEEQYEEFAAAYDEALSGKTFWLDRNEDLQSRKPMFCFFDGDLGTIDNWEFIDINTSVREAR